MQLAYLSSLTDEQLVRLHNRILDHLVKVYGTSSWDYPTLFAVYPQLARVIAMIHDIYRDR